MGRKDDLRLDDGRILGTVEGVLVGMREGVNVGSTLGGKELDIIMESTRDGLVVGDVINSLWSTTATELFSPEVLLLLA